MALSDEFKAKEGTFEVDLFIEHHFVADEVYLKRMVIPTGATVGTHAHPFDHVSLLAKGSVRVDTDDSTSFHDAPAYITIRAHVFHKITALKPSHWFCVHVTDETNPDRIDDALLQRAEG